MHFFPCILCILIAFMGLQTLVLQNKSMANSRLAYFKGITVLMMFLCADMYGTSECICNLGMCSVRFPQPARCCMIQPTLTHTKPLRCYWSLTSFKKRGNVSQPRPRSHRLPIRDLRWEEIMKGGKGGGVRQRGREWAGERERGLSATYSQTHTHTQFLTNNPRALPHIRRAHVAAPAFSGGRPLRGPVHEGLARCFPAAGCWRCPWWL